MKKSASFIAICCLIFFSCSESENKTSNRIDSFVSLPIPLDTFTEMLVKNDSLPIDSAPITPIEEGKVYYQTSYCGGAHPSEEILAENDKLRLLTKSKLKLKNKSGEFFIITDDKGNFTSSIPYGTYSVFLTKETNPKIQDVSADACDNCLTQVMTTVKIREGKKVFIQFRFPCDPGARLRP